jgi:hypothetical protein
MTFLHCPAPLGEQGTERCGLPAEVQYRYTVESSDGPVESAKIRCPGGHWFNGPITSLVRQETAQRDSEPFTAPQGIGPHDRLPHCWAGSRSSPLSFSERGNVGDSAGASWPVSSRH